MPKKARYTAAHGKHSRFDNVTGADPAVCTLAPDPPQVGQDWTATFHMLAPGGWFSVFYSDDEGTGTNALQQANIYGDVTGWFHAWRSGPYSVFVRQYPDPYHQADGADLYQYDFVVA